MKIIKKYIKYGYRNYNNSAVFDDGSEWTLFRGFNTCESNVQYNIIYIK